MDFEFSELGEVNHASCALQTQLARPGLAELVQLQFVEAHLRKFPHEKGCELILLFEVDGHFDRWIGLAVNALFNPTGGTEFHRSRCLVPASASTKRERHT